MRIKRVNVCKHLGHTVSAALVFVKYRPVSGVNNLPRISLKERTLMSKSSQLTQGCGL